MTPATITQWLNEPTCNLDAAELAVLKMRYPYFLPLHYMEAGLAQGSAANSKVSLYPDLYMGNRLLYQRMLLEAGAQLIAIPALTIAEVAIEEIESKIEDAAGDRDPDNSAADAVKEPMPLKQELGDTDYLFEQPMAREEQLADEPMEKMEAEKDVPMEDPKSLMVMMSFTEWLMHYKTTTQKEKEELADRKAVKHMWQKEKLAAALDEDDDEIPENVFEMAVNSLTKEDGLASESLAEILTRQGKWEKAIEMYKNLSLRNPQKSGYFAQQIATIQKNLD